jgi:hypothetical protein
MKLKNLFGEPAVITSVIAAAIALAISFGLDWSNEQVGLVMAAVTAALGLYTAYATTGTVLSVFVGFAQSVLALAVGFGLHLSADKVGAIIAFITVALGFYNRTQNSPITGDAEPAHAA